jgi:nicotinate-nucleotide pyrophosphorylase (carboxylating)
VSGSGPDVHPPAEAVREAVARALAEDLLPLGDLTAALVPAGTRATLTVSARVAGVIAGQRCAEAAFAMVDPVPEVTWRIPEGGAAAPGDVVGEVRGAMRPILSAERTALNFLGHLSGVATLTARYVAAVAAVRPEVHVLDTRKTTPGLRALEKAAVRAGGGRNHRASLSDAVLVKDNHLGGVSVADAVARALAWWPGRMVEVECERFDQVEEACRAGATAILLDNMTPEDAARGVELVRRLTPGRRVLVEASGNVSLETAPRYAAAGVDLISVGALTHSVVAMDLGLDLVADPATVRSDHPPDEDARSR